MTSAPATPIALHLECSLHPAATMSQLTKGLPAALDALRRAGVPVQVLRVELRGLGDACLDALERELAVPVTAPAQAPIYFAKNPLANETPQERQARHARRFGQVLAGGCEAPEGTPGWLGPDPVPAAPPQEDDQ